MINLMEDKYLIGFNYSDVYNTCKEYILESIGLFRPEFLCDYMDNISLNDISIIQRSIKNEEALNNIFLALIGDRIEELVEDAINIDGFGHFLSPYDGITYVYQDLSDFPDLEDQIKEMELPDDWTTDFFFFLQ